MVISRNVSAYNGVIPTEGKPRDIGKTPCYALAAAKEVASDTSKIIVATNDCAKDLKDMGYGPDDIKNLICRLGESDYRKSIWCKASSGHWIACDEYSVMISEYIQTMHKTAVVEYYVKFGLKSSGILFLLVSFHPSN